MRYKLLGESGLRVSEICLGCMTLGEEWGWGASKAESQKIFSTFVERGGNFLDTANLYTNGSSEKFLGEFIASDRDKYVLATKYTCSMRKGDPNFSGNHRKNMVQSLEASLKRLNTSYVDLFWVHAWDHLTPTEEMMRGLDDLVRAGKVLYIGISDTPAWVVAKANTLADLRGWTSFVGLQVEYSLIQRTPERDLIPMAESFGLAVTAWAPLGGGVLTGKYSATTSGDSKRGDLNQGRLNEKNIAIGSELQTIAVELGKKPSQVALNWVRQKKGVMIPIVGSRTAIQMAENMDCLTFQLNDEQMKRLDKLSQIDLGFPHDFLSNERVQDIVYGGTLPMVDR